MKRAVFYVLVGFALASGGAHAAKSAHWFGGEVCVQRTENESICYVVTAKMDGDTIMIYPGSDETPRGHGWLARATVEKEKEM